MMFCGSSLHLGIQRMTSVFATMQACLDTHTHLQLVFRHQQHKQRYIFSSAQSAVFSIYSLWRYTPPTYHFNQFPVVLHISHIPHTPILKQIYKCTDVNARHFSCLLYQTLFHTTTPIPIFGAAFLFIGNEGT